MSTVSRRQFIQIGGMTAGGAVLASGVGTAFWGADASELAGPATDGDSVVPTFCETCFWNCGMLAHVKGGRVTKLVGNPEHPLSRGRLCPRGVGSVGLLYDPDRLRRPLVRVRDARRGAERFEEVSWDIALGEVAEKLEAVRRRHGPEAVALFTHGFGGSWFKQLMKAFGSPNVAAPSYAQCRGPREAGFALTFGTALGSPEPIDLANARCITLIGSHLGENMHNTQVQDFAEALGRGAALVVVDPRFSVAASKARYWLPIRPGTDTALLLAWMNVILGEHLYDAEYLARHAVGLEELRAHVADKTPEWAHVHTGVSAELIRDSARLIAGARPASLIHPGRHTVWTGADTQRARAMAILAALLGSWGRRGGYVQHTRMELPQFPGLPAAHVTAERGDRPREGGFPMADELLASGLCRASLPGYADEQIRAWIVYGTNLLQALPQPDETVRAIRALEHLVVVDVLPSEIAGWADVVLPECTFLEREDDLWNGAWREPFLALRRAAVPPRFASKPGWWIAKELGRRLGHGAAFPFRDATEWVRARVAAGHYDWDTLWTTGVLHGPPAPTCEEEGLPIQIATESGKIELRSAALAASGFDALPVYVPPDEPPPGMFRLLTGRSPLHTFGRTVNNRLLGEAYPENEVWIHAAAARELPGFEDRPLATGDRVMLVNQDGVRTGPVEVRVTERIRGDCVYLVHGWGQRARRLRRAHGRGASDARLTTRVAVDPIMGGTGMNVNFVRLEPEEVAS